MAGPDTEDLPTKADVPSAIADGEPTHEAETRLLAAGSLDETGRRVRQPPPDADDQAAVVDERRVRSLSADELTTIASPVDAMRREEIERVRIFSRLMIGLAIFGVGVSPLIGGFGLAKWIFWASLLVVAGAYTALLWITRDPDRYTEALVGIVAQLCCVAGSGTCYFFGVFSPAPMVVAVGLYVYAQGTSFHWSFAAYTHLSVGQAVMAGLIITDVWQDNGLVHANYMSTWDQVVVQVCVLFIYSMAFFIGRASRAKTLEAITELEHAVRTIAEREALLNEARQELERAGWAGGPGRFTDQQLGSFRLGNVIGRGGMGEVYEAENVASGEMAAVKLLQRNVLSNPQHVARFAREANAAASLQVPNVVRVLEVGDETAPIPYLAMERLEGEDLADVLRRRRRLSLREVVEMVGQVAAGLEAARQAGIVHRDLKPQNLWRCESGGRAVTWKVFDFGVSKIAGHSGTLTRDHVVGTPGYMSPEQARGKDVDHRADVYALAAIAYRSLTGRPVFSGSDIPALLYKVVSEMPVRPGQLVEVSDDIDHVLLVGMAKKKSQRFATAIELADALRAAARGKLGADLRTRALAIAERTPWRVGA